MVTVLLDEVVQTDYGQLEIVWDGGAEFDGDFDRFFAGQVNGLVGAADPDCLYINLARRCGGSQVRIELCESAPVPDPRWEDVVEVSVTVPDGATPHWYGWDAWSDGALDLSPGRYRVRVSARGRDAGHADEWADECVDFYLLQLWASDWEPDTIVRTASVSAAYWHRENGGRRS